MASALPDRSPPQNPRPIAPAKAAPAPGSTGTGGTGERCSDRWNDGPSAEKSDRRRSRLFPSFLGHRTETAGGLQLYDWLPSCVHIYIHRRYIYEKNRKTRDIAQHPVQNRKKPTSLYVAQLNLAQLAPCPLHRAAHERQAIDSRTLSRNFLLGSYPIAPESSTILESGRSLASGNRTLEDGDGGRCRHQRDDDGIPSSRPASPRILIPHPQRYIKNSIPASDHHLL
jgi:hypothetical protein